MSSIKIIGAVCGVGLFAAAGYFYFESQRIQSETDALRAITASTPAVKAKIWIGDDGCKTSFGPNTIAFCEGRSLDTSLFLDSGADAAVKACFEYTAEKLEMNASQAVEIACMVKEAYQERDYEFDEATQTYGIQNSNYGILNEWVNRD